jgi:hypothetical protein
MLHIIDKHIYNTFYSVLLTMRLWLLLQIGITFEAYKSIIAIVYVRNKKCISLYKRKKKSLRGGY